MSEIERLTRQLDECRSEISFLQNELGKARQHFAAADALNAEAAKAGPIVDARIKELEAKLAVSNTRRHEQAAEIEQLLRDLAAERTAPATAPTEQREETELERRAWELFVAAMAANDGYLRPEKSFVGATQWMAHRDERRKAGAT